MSSSNFTYSLKQRSPNLKKWSCMMFIKTQILLFAKILRNVPLLKWFDVYYKTRIFSTTRNKTKKSKLKLWRSLIIIEPMIFLVIKEWNQEVQNKIKQYFNV